jgi:hypothetical protein
MAGFGWAYIRCSDTGSSDDIQGSAEQILFVTADDTASGSSNFVFLTGSNTVVLSGSLKVEGPVTASVFVSDLSLTGSTFFGNDNTDVHVRTGSLIISGPSTAYATPTLYASSSYVGINTITPDYSLAVTGTLGVSGNSSLHGNVTLGNAATDVTTVTSQLTASGGLLVSAPLTASAAAHFNSTLTARGTVTLGDAASDVTTANSQVTASAGLSVTGDKFNSTVDASLLANTTLGNAADNAITIVGAHVKLNNVSASTDNTVLILNSENKIAHDEIDSKVWAGKLVDYTGTPANNQIAVFTDQDTVEGDNDLTWNDGISTLGVIGTVSSSVGVSTGAVTARTLSASTLTELSGTVYMGTAFATSLSASTFISASAFVGDGSTLSGIPDIVGTPSANQVTVWHNSDTIKGNSTFTFNSSTGLMAVQSQVSASQLVLGGQLQASGNISITQPTTTNGGSNYRLFIGSETEGGLMGFLRNNSGQLQAVVQGYNTTLRLESHANKNTEVVLGSNANQEQFQVRNQSDNVKFYVDVTGSVSASNEVEAGSFKGISLLNRMYSPVRATPYTASAASGGYILGVSRSAGGDFNMEVRLPEADDVGSGAVFVIKDEVLSRTTTAIYVSASSGDTIDGAPSFTVTGSMASINLYSNGDNKWFIF